mgnify:CR=1 FL=1
MCGFVLAAGALHPISHRALGRLRRRGPDGTGFWASREAVLVHARLAVINPSDEGLQPVEHADWVGVFNGEVYNWLSLRRPEERSDAAVLLRLFAEGGSDALRDVNGFWALAAISPDGCVHLVRDQLGVRPLYYAHGKDWLVAASTLRALVPLLPERPELDYQAMSEWALYQMTLSDHTFFKDVRSLAPGHHLVFPRDGAVGVHRYEDIWAPGTATPDDAWVRDAQEKLVQAIVEATSSDVGFTTTCSGGLDSSVVTRIVEPPLAYHANYSSAEYNETGWAQAVVAGTRTRLYTVNATEPKFLDLCTRVDELVQDQDDITVGSVILPLSELFEAISRRYKVVLLGTGGDELFGGYVRLDIARGKLGDQSAYRAVFDRLAGVLDPVERYDFLHRKGNARIFRFFDAEHASGAFRAALADEHFLQFERRHFLRALLTIDDRIGGRYGVEGRPALLHQTLVRHVAALDPEKVLAGGLKSVARKVFEPFLPATVLNRSDKKGFPTPIGAIVNANAAQIRERISSSPHRHLYDLAQVHWTTEDAYDRQLFGLLQLDAWLESFSTT